MEKIGIILDNLGPSAAAYLLIRSINEYLLDHDGVSPVLFYHNLTPLCLNVNCSVCTLFEAFSFNGILVSSNLNNASRSLEYIGATSRYFMPIDLEYTKNNQAGYEQLSQIYCNKKLPIIARSENFKSIFELTFGSNVIGVVNDFNFGELVKVILDYEKNIK